MEQIRQTTAPSRLFYGLLIFAWTLTLASVALVLYNVFPPPEHRVTESYAAEDAHRPWEAYRYLRYQAKMEAYQPYLEALTGGEYEAVFLAMYSLESFETEDFRYYRGLSTLIIEPVFENSLELLEALEQLLACDTLPERIYLGIDPVKLEQHLVWEEELDWQETVAALVGSMRMFPGRYFWPIPRWQSGRRCRRRYRNREWQDTGGPWKPWRLWRI